MQVYPISVEDARLKDYNDLIPDAKVIEVQPIEPAKYADIFALQTEKKEYSIEEKIATLVCLKENAYNYSKTSQITGITPLTIKQWRREHGKELEKIAVDSYYSEMRLISDYLEERQKESKDKFVKAAHVVKMMTLNRISEILPEERNLRFLSDTLKVLQEITEGNNPSNDTKQTTNNFLQMVQNQIITVAKHSE